MVEIHNTIPFEHYPRQRGITEVSGSPEFEAFLAEVNTIVTKYYPEAEAVLENDTGSDPPPHSMLIGIHNAPFRLDVDFEVDPVRPVDFLIYGQADDDEDGSFNEADPAFPIELRQIKDALNALMVD